MFNYKVVRELNYSNKQMFDLIIDVEKYPEFLPWCKSTNVYEKWESSLLLCYIIVLHYSFTLIIM